MGGDRRGLKTLHKFISNFPFELGKKPQTITNRTSSVLGKTVLVSATSEEMSSGGERVWGSRRSERVGKKNWECQENTAKVNLEVINDIHQTLKYKFIRKNMDWYMVLHRLGARGRNQSTREGERPTASPMSGKRVGANNCQ